LSMSFRALAAAFARACITLGVVWFWLSTGSLSHETVNRNRQKQVSTM
jgi:hypothetical protein